MRFAIEFPDCQSRHTHCFLVFSMGMGRVFEIISILSEMVGEPAPTSQRMYQIKRSFLDKLPDSFFAHIGNNGIPINQFLIFY